MTSIGATSCGSRFLHDRHNGSGMTRRTLQPWKCKRGHVLGMIQVNSQRRPILMLYRHAIDLDLEPPRVAAEVDVMGVLVGGMRNIRCDVCGGVQEWTAWHRRPGRRATKPLDK